MKASEREYEESLLYLREKLAQPEQEVDNWLNDIVDKWITIRKDVRKRRRHG